MKKVLSILLILCVLLSMLVGCIGNFISKEKKEMMYSVLPGAKGFEDINLSLYQDSIDEYESENYFIFNDIKREVSGLGYAIEVTIPKDDSIPPTYSEMKFMVGVSLDGKITGIILLNYNEQFGFEKNFGDMIIGLDINELCDEFNATVDERDSLDETIYYANLVYCSVAVDCISIMCIVENKKTDLFTEEQRISKKLNEALPEANGCFTKVEVFQGNSEWTVFEADNGSGYVCQFRLTTFIAIDNDGNVRGDFSESDKEKAKEVLSYAKANRIYSVDLSAYSDNEIIANRVSNVFLLGDGRYYIEVKTKGYRSGLIIGVIVDSNGVVFDAFCVYSNETFGLENTLGEKFVGKDKDTAVDVEAGATSLTVKGYRNAIIDAIAVFEILKETK